MTAHVTNHTCLGIHREVAPHPNTFEAINRIRAPLDARGRHRLWVGVLPELNVGEALEEADEHE